MSSLPQCWKTAEAALKFSRRRLFYGPPSTGKSYASLYYGLKEDQKIYSVTLTQDTPAAELRGFYIPVGNSFVWKDGPAILAWRSGGRLVLNEVDHSGGDTLSFLLAVMDDIESAVITLPSGETVRPDPRFEVVGTMNGQPEDLPEALLDRFPASIAIPQVHPKAMKKIPQKYRKAVNDHLDNARGSERISLRSWLEFFAMKKQAGCSAELAGAAIFGQRYQDVLRALEVAELP